MGRRKEASGHAVGRGNLFTCCLGFASLLGWMFVLILTGASVMAVIVKLLQLRFVGTVHVRDWGVAEVRWPPGGI